MLKNPTLYAACNMDYFYSHGYTFAKSAIDHQNYVRISVWHDEFNSETQTKYLKFMTQFYQTIGVNQCKIDLVSHKTLDVIKKSSNVIELRAFYASMRFILLEEILEQELENDRSVLVLDIDSIIRNKIEVDDKYDIGIFSRENEIIHGTEYEQHGMKIAAGALYLSENAVEFARDIKENIINDEIKWFCDQKAIYESYLSMKQYYDIWYMDKTFLDWEFTENSTVWSAKGSRKFENQTYLNEKVKILNGFNSTISTS